MDAWKAGFASANPGATVQYSPDGSGAGRKAILDGSAQFGGSDAYLKDEEVRQLHQPSAAPTAPSTSRFTSPRSPWPSTCPTSRN